MDIEIKALNNNCDIIFQSTTEIDPQILLEVAKSRENMVANRGESWAADAIPALGKNLVEVALAGNLGDAVDKAAMEVTMAAWLYESIFKGLDSIAFIKSNLNFTMTGNGIVRYTRTLPNN